ncbi:hypothetical protein VPP93_gp40 [Vibrio phage VP93]|uniref:Uncharacterized protein n=1 Tax=Vibrio phage VP93 TaxID=641832 RepID=C3VVT0_9CAUD|nr:hypothetical protein VPP93_gp40 [Vibrio phage VP93]ACP44111.1 hypothetical protein VPP93_gp40 [Vibrio phage VP93]
MQIVIPYRKPGLPVIPWVRAAVRIRASELLRWEFPDELPPDVLTQFVQDCREAYPVLREGQVEAILGMDTVAPVEYTHSIEAAVLVADAVVGFNPGNGSLAPVYVSDGTTDARVYALEVNNASGFCRLTLADNLDLFTTFTMGYGNTYTTLTKAGKNRWETPKDADGVAFTDAMYNLLNDNIGVPVAFDLIGNK